MTKIDHSAVAAPKTNMFVSPKGVGQRIGDSAFLAYMALPLSPLTQEISTIHAAIPDSTVAMQKPGSKDTEGVLPSERGGGSVSDAPARVHFPAKPLKTIHEIIPEDFLENDPPCLGPQDGFSSEKTALQTLGMGSTAITVPVEMPKSDEPISPNPRRDFATDQPTAPILGQPTRENAFQLRTDSPVNFVHDGHAVRSKAVESRGGPIAASKGEFPTTDQPTLMLNRVGSQDLAQSITLGQRLPDTPADHAVNKSEVPMSPPVLVADADKTAAFPIGTNISAEHLAEGPKTTALPESALINLKTDFGSGRNGPLLAKNAEQTSKLIPKHPMRPDHPTQFAGNGVTNTAIQTAPDSVTKPLKAAIPSQVSSSAVFQTRTPTTELATLQPTQYTNPNRLGPLDLQRVVDDSRSITITSEPIAKAVSTEGNPSQLARPEPLTASFEQVYLPQLPSRRQQPNMVLQGAQAFKQGPVEAQAAVTLPESKAVFRTIPQSELPRAPSAFPKTSADVKLPGFVANALMSSSPDSLYNSMSKNDVIAPNSSARLSYSESGTSGLPPQDSTGTLESASKVILASTDTAIAPRQIMSNVQPITVPPIAPLVNRDDFKIVPGQPSLETPKIQQVQAPTRVETTFAEPVAREVSAAEVPRPVSTPENRPYGDVVGILPGKSGAPHLAAATAMLTTVFVPVPVPVSALPQHIKTLFSADKPSSIELSLTPEDLGKLRLVFTPEGDKLRIIIQAERPETLDLLRRNTESFSADLRQSGYASTSFSFASWGDAPSSRSNPKQDNADESFDSAEEPQAKPAHRATSIKLNGLDLRV